MADSSKYGRIGFAQVLPLEEIDLLITDNELEEEAIRRIEARSVEVMVVQKRR